jgi:Trypsin Inhibitor like cysteine rich domain
MQLWRSHGGIFLLVNKEKLRFQTIKFQSCLISGSSTCPNQAEIWQTCACNTTCENAGKDNCDSTNCKEGCFCSGGQVRDENNNCVWIRNCPKYQNFDPLVTEAVLN